MWTPAERLAIRDALDFIATRGRGGRARLVTDGVDPQSVVLGLILVADYAIDVAATATSCVRAEIIRALEADALACDAEPP